MKTLRSYPTLAIAAVLAACSLSTSKAHADLDAVMAEHPTASVVGAGAIGVAAGTVIGKGIVSAVTWLSQDYLTISEQINLREFRGSLALTTEPNEHRIAIVTSAEAIRRHSGRPHVVFFNSKAWGHSMTNQLVVEGTPLISNKYLWNSVHHQYGYPQEMIIAYPRHLGESGERMLLNSFCANIGEDESDNALPYIPVPYAGGYKAEEVYFEDISEAKMIFFLMSDTETLITKKINDGILDKVMGRKAEVVEETVPYPSVKLNFWKPSAAMNQAGNGIFLVKRIDSLTCSSIAPKK